MAPRATNNQSIPTGRTSFAANALGGGTSTMPGMNMKLSSGAGMNLGGMAGLADGVAALSMNTRISDVRMSMSAGALSRPSVVGGQR
jgi:hypothetical protein